MAQPGIDEVLSENGMAGADLNIRLIVGGTRFCPAGGDGCEAPTAGQ